MTENNIDSKPLFEASYEYRTLRDELLEGRRFVFERPLLIVTASLAALKFAEGQMMHLIPGILIAIMIFNLLFTTQRLRSIARISAYINIVLEQELSVKWIGWETFLRSYRIFVSKNPKAIAKIETNKYYDRQAPPNSMIFYPSIYYFHLLIIIVAFVFSLFLFWAKISSITVNELSDLAIPFGFGITAIATIFAIPNLHKYRPKEIGKLIEKSRAICHLTIESMGISFDQNEKDLS